MKRAIAILSLLLICQIGVSVWLYSGDSGMEAYSTDERLLALNLANFDAITIEGGDEEEALKLVKVAGRWSLENGFPVADMKLSLFNEQLFRLLRSWPVGTTAVAARQFRVTDDDFERRILLYQGDKPTKKIFLGTSPGFRKVHLRVDGKSEIFSVDFNAHDLPLDPEQWRDAGLLRVNRVDLERVELPGITLVRDEGELRLSDLAEDEEMEKDKLSNLLRLVTGLSFQEVLEESDAKQYEQKKPVFQFALELREVGEVSYRFFESEEPQDADGEEAAATGKNYILKSSQWPFSFKVAEATVHGLKNIRRQELVKEKEAEVVEEGEEAKENELLPEDEAEAEAEAEAVAEEIEGEELEVVAGEEEDGVSLKVEPLLVEDDVAGVGELEQPGE